MKISKNTINFKNERLAMLKTYFLLVIIILIGLGNFSYGMKRVDSTQIIYITLLDGFINGERIKITLSNGKGEEVIFKGRLDRSEFNVNFFEAKIINNEVNDIEITCMDRNVSTVWGLLIKDTPYINLDISINKDDFHVIFTDRPGVYD